MDPLGVLLEGLSKYFEPAFLAFILVICYLWFFAFFFKTKHWDYLGWGERFFLGFLIGVFLVFVFALIEVPLIIILITIYAEQAVDAVLYLFPICSLLSVFLFRETIRAPLSSIKAQDRLWRLLKNHRSYWPYLLLISSVVAYFALGWGNVFYSEMNRTLWLGLILLLNFGAFVVYYSFFVLIAQLCYYNAETSRIELFEMVFKFCFLSFGKGETEAYVVREIKGKQSRRSSFFRAGLSFLRNDFFHKAVLVALLSFVIVLADSAFYLFRPAIEVVQTDYESDKVEVFKFYYAPVVYTIEVTKTYWVSLPLFRIRNLNLSIPNPSNFSTYDGSKYLPWEKRPYSIRVEAGPSISYTVTTNSEREIESVNIMPTNVSQSSGRSFVILTYKDQLNLELIEVTEPKRENLGNGIILVTMCLFVNNTEPRRLSSDEFALFSVADYGNLTSFMLLENGHKNPSQLEFIRDQWLWFSFSAGPTSFLNLTISATFEEVTT